MGPFSIQEKLGGSRVVHGFPDPECTHLDWRSECITATSYFYNILSFRSSGSGQVICFDLTETHHTLML